MGIPILLAPTEYGLMVIDGWHRVARGTLLGLESLPGVVLTEDEVKEVVLWCMGEVKVRKQVAHLTGLIRELGR